MDTLDFFGSLFLAVALSCLGIVTGALTWLIVWWIFGVTGIF